MNTPTPIANATTATHPITIPAMAPSDNPELEGEDAEASLTAEAESSVIVLFDVPFFGSKTTGTVVGSVTVVGSGVT